MQKRSPRMTAEEAAQLQRQTQVSIPLDIIKSASFVICPGTTEHTCNNVTFVPVVMFKKLNALISPTGKDELFPIKAMACNACGSVLNEMLPPELQLPTKNDALNGIIQTT